MIRADYAPQWRRHRLHAVTRPDLKDLAYALAIICVALLGTAAVSAPQ